MFCFKSKFKHYNQVDTDAEEKFFRRWEDLCKLIHPLDWHDDGYLFIENLKRIYDKYDQKAKRDAKNRYNIDDLMKDDS